MTDFTGFQESMCDQTLLHASRRVIAVLFAGNIAMAITATLGNTMILVALQKASSLHPPSKLFLRNLAVTDLCIGIISQPVSAVFLKALVKGPLDLCYISKSIMHVTATLMLGLSLQSMTALSVDRLLALLLKLRYKQVVTLRRARIAVIFSWLYTIPLALLFLWKKHIYFIVSSASVFLCVVISSCCYLTIFRCLKHQHAQVHDHVTQGQENGPQMSIARYKKTVSRAVCIYWILVTCSVPIAICMALRTVIKMNQAFLIAQLLTASLPYCNSSLNPFIYCWKIREVRQAVKDTLRKCCV